MLDFKSQLPTILSKAFGAFNAFSNISSGIDIQRQSGEVAAQGLEQSAAQVGAIAEYNIQLDRLATAKRLDVTSRDIRQVTSQQRTQLANRGLSLTSQSALSIMNNTLDIFERKILDIRNVQNIREDQRRFSAEQEKVSLIEQATAQRFETELGIFRSRRKQASGVANTLTQITQTLLQGNKNG